MINLPTIKLGCHLKSIQNGIVNRIWILIPDRIQYPFVPIFQLWNRLYRFVQPPEVYSTELHRLKAEWRHLAQSSAHSFHVGLISPLLSINMADSCQAQHCFYMCVCYFVHLMHWVLLLSQPQCSFTISMALYPFFSCLVSLFILPSEF
jgi:hypothetical protein